MKGFANQIFVSDNEVSTGLTSKFKLYPVGTVIVVPFDTGGDPAEPAEPVSVYPSALPEVRNTFYEPVVVPR